MLSLFFRFAGEIPRKKFWIGFAGIAIYVMAGNALLRALDNTMIAFYISLIFPFLALYMIYCVYGKRLRDMGHTAKLLSVMIILEIMAVIIVMLAFGGAEYFSEFSQYSRKEDIDPVVRDAIIQKYQDKLNANNRFIQPILLGIPILFTLYVGLSEKRR